MSSRLAWPLSRVASPRWRAPRMDGWLLAAGIGFFALLLVALFGSRLAPHEPVYFVLEHEADPRPYEPGVVFPFGSDVLGRDMLSLVLAGAGTTLAIALLGGAARVLAGAALATAGSRWRPLSVRS